MRRERGERTINPIVEKVPQHKRIARKTDHITQHQLRAEAPPEEAKVARMAQDGVDPVLDERVAVLALDLHRVVEVTACLDHSEGAGYLADGHEGQAQRDLGFCGCGVKGPGEEGRPEGVR